MSDFTKTSKFLVIEGCDGSGKTTVASLLATRLRDSGKEVHVTSEPSRGPIGALLRNILQKKVSVPKEFEGYQASPTLKSLPLLFAADRLEHIEFEVNPRLKKGQWVISDRYYHSSLAYQAMVADVSWVHTLNQEARAPDCTFILEAPTHIISARRNARQSPKEMYDDANIQSRLAKAYRTLPSLLPKERIDYIDATQSPRQIVDAILDSLC